jgi:DNA-binding MarR family transcriptional regulator
MEQSMNSLNELDNTKQPKVARPMGVAYMIGRLERGLYRQIRTALSPLGVTVSQYTALSVFNARGHMSNAQLADRTMVSPQAANELIKSMECQGWIQREPDKTHKRIIQISLTESGKELLIQCDEIISVMEERMMEELSEEERALLKRQLRGMMRLLLEL